MSSEHDHGHSHDHDHSHAHGHTPGAPTVRRWPRLVVAGVLVVIAALAATLGAVGRAAVAQ